MMRGSAIRVTRLDGRGFYDPTAVEYGISKSVTRVKIDEVTESGGVETLRSEMDKPRVRIVKPDQTIRYEVSIEFIGCDPSILSLVSGSPVVRNAKGDVVGFDTDTRLPAQSFGLEVWSKVPDSVGAALGVGFDEGGFGVIPFGGGTRASRKRYGYTLFPFLKGGWVSGFRFENGAVSFNLTRARTSRGSRWLYGPHELDGKNKRLIDLVSRNTNWRTFLTASAPPEPLEGTLVLEDIIHGGTPDSTTTDILSGGTAESAGPYAISGGAP